MVRDGWDDDPEPEVEERKIPKLSGVAPRYGGIPVELSVMLSKAREEGDSDAELEVHKQRKAHFRNRRTPVEKSGVEIRAKVAFIEKYGEAGEIAVAKTDLGKKYASMSREEQNQYIESILATQPQTEEE